MEICTRIRALSLDLNCMCGDAMTSFETKAGSAEIAGQGHCRLTHRTCDNETGKMDSPTTWMRCASATPSRMSVRRSRTAREPGRLRSWLFTQST